MRSHGLEFLFILHPSHPQSVINQLISLKHFPLCSERPRSRKQNVKAFMHMFRLLLINAGIICEVPLILFTKNYLTEICIIFEYALFSNQSISELGI